MTTKPETVQKPVLDSKDESSVGDVDDKFASLTVYDLRELPVQRQVEAFKLTTDAQAQRRNLSNNLIYRNSTFLGSFFLMASFIIYKLRQRALQNDLTMEWGTLMLSISGLAMAMFSAVSKYTEEIINKAERMDIDEIFGADKDVFVMIYKTMVVAVLSVRRTPADEEGKLLLKEETEAKELKLKEMDSFEREKHESIQSNKIKVLHTVPDNTALVAAWTVLRRYRGIGLGKDLLSKAEEIAKNKFKANKIVVVTESTEIPANSILQKKGYKKTQSAKCKGYRGSWFDIREFVWTKELSKADEKK